MKNQEKKNQPVKAKKSKDLATFMVAGLIIGALIGIVTDNLTLWMGTGMCLGIVIGALSGA
ncbi:MAG: hypothetical protein ACK2U1_03880 [Anaerolineales bacterium]|jgi:F0F1-type ATP synthase assembly protein I